MNSWSGKTRGGICGYKIFVFLLRNVGISAAYFLLNFVALYYFFFSRKAFKYQYYLFHTIFGYSIAKAMLSVYRNFILLGQTLIDKVCILSGTATHFTFDFEGEEHLRKIAKDGKGGILLNAHIGNWETAGQLLNRLSCNINILLMDIEHENIKRLLDQVMVVKSENTQVKIIVEKKDFSHLIEIKKTILNNEILVLHGDRFVPGMKVLSTTFMDKKATFPYGPFFLAVRFGVPVSFVFALKERKNHYHFFATPAKVYTPANSTITESDLLPILNDYTATLEKVLRKYPLQWFNYYPFWENQT